MNKLAIALLSVVTAFSGLAPAQAMPIVKIQTAQVSNDIVQVRDRRIIPRHGGWRGRDGRDFIRHGGHYPRYGGGWRDNNRYGGWRHDNRRYGRYYDRGGYGIGVPLGAFAAGAIIGGALNTPRVYQPRVYRPSAYGNSHVSWCANRYRSYRAYDNSFQPYNGPRQACYSPYR